MKLFYVTDLNKLKDFGFKFDSEHGYYSLRTKRAMNAFVDVDDSRLIFYSASTDAVAIMCEMYAQGVIKIVDEESQHYGNMKVTEEERKAILDLRKHKL